MPPTWVTFERSGPNHFRVARNKQRNNAVVEILGATAVTGALIWSRLERSFV